MPGGLHAKHGRHHFLKRHTAVGVLHGRSEASSTRRACNHNFRIAANPEWRELPSAANLPYTFTFRFALCAYLHALHWIAAGNAARKPEDFRNDLVDVAIVAFATCFDGLLSNDKLANEVYENAMFLLKDGFLRKELQPDRKRAQ